MTQKFKKDEFESDSRSVSEVWNRALQAYNETTETILAVGKFADTQAMIDFGSKEMNQFHKWRHDDKKVDKLRRLFIGNIDFIEKGISQVVSAASTAFPPAAAIGTAMTFVLSACKSVSADYDVVINFFEDMNNFLQRVTIVANRVPRKRAYQNALVDVFSSFLSMCAIAHKFIKLDRFKKWAINAVFGGDAALAAGRKAMDTALSRLQSATEFAILDNSENMLDKQNELGDAFADFQRQLLQNQKVQDRLASSQSLAIQSLSDDLQAFRDEIKELLKLQAEQQQQQPEITHTEASDDTNVPNHRIRTFFGSMPNALAPLRLQERSRVPGTGAWLFKDTAWVEWMKWDAEAPDLLCIEGPAGIGKSYLLACIYQHLNAMAQQDSQNVACVIYFPFSSEPFFRNFMALIFHGAVQIADQSVPLREHLEAKLTNDESIFTLADGTQQTYWNFFYHHVFTKDSKFQLYMVLDGLDNVSDEHLKQEIPKLLTSIRQDKARIKVVCTGRSSGSEVSTDKTIIRIDKHRILPDLRNIVWDRLHQNDSAYEGLKKLQKHTKQKLARKIEQHADGLRYVEQMLRYLSGVYRETGINKILDGRMPNTVSELYETILDNSKYNASVGVLVAMRTIITWVIFAFRPLTLGELGLLVKRSSASDITQDLEEALNKLSPFIEVRNTSSSSGENEFNVDLNTLFETTEVISDSPTNAEDKFQVNLKERSMETFFATADNKGHYLMPSRSQAHYQMFVTSAQFILENNLDISSDTTSTTLRTYALQSLFTHWAFINTSEHSEEEKLMVLKSFARLILNRKYASALERLPHDLTVSDLSIGDDFQSDWQCWANIAKDATLDQDHHDYWSGDPGDALWPVAKWHTRNWLDSKGATGATRAYKFARDITKHTKYAYYLDRSFDFEDAEPNTADGDSGPGTMGSGAADATVEIKNFEIASDIDVGGNAHFAISVVLAERGSLPAAIRELDHALDAYSSLSERARNYTQFVAVYSRLSDYDATIKYANLALGAGDDPSMLSVGDILKARYLAENMRHKTNISKNSGSQNPVSENTTDKAVDQYITGSMYCQVLQTKAIAEDALGMHGAAAATLAEARVCNPELVTAEILINELTYLWNDDQRCNAIIDTLMSFKPLERLHLLTSSRMIDDDDLTPTGLAGPSRLLLVASMRSRRQSDLIKVFEEVVAKLDAKQMGAPLRLRLAVVLWSVGEDLEKAKKLLSQVLDGVTEELVYELTNIQVAVVAHGAMSTLANIILEEFGRSTNVEDKLLLFLEAKSIPQRSLVATVGFLPSTLMFDWRFCMAKMARKAGTIVEYQSIMQTLFDTAIGSLSDSTTLNDSVNVVYLTQILGLMPELREMALLVLSTYYYSLEATEPELELNEASGNNSESAAVLEQGHDTASTVSLNAIGASEDSYPLDDDPNILMCAGICYPTTVFQPGWNLNNPWYLCLACPAIICQKCYETRRKWNADISSKPETDPYFCCTNNQYLCGPAKGFRGVKNGVLYLDEEPTGLQNGDQAVNGHGVRRIPFKQLLEDVKVAWKKTLDVYNSGY